jgi:hypothetical protein
MLVVGSPAAAQFRPRPIDESPASERFVIEGGVGLWNPSPSLTFSSEGLGIIGTTIDLVQDLGLSQGRFADIRVAARLGRKHKFRYQLIPMNYTQSTTIGRDLVFNGQRYRRGVSVTSEFDWKASRISYEYDFLTASRGFGGVILDLKQTFARATLRAPGIDEFTRLRATVPAIGGIARVYVTPAVSITGELSGIRIPSGAGGASRGHYTELDIHGTYNVTPRVAAQVGYRAFDVAAIVDDDSGTFTLKGLYFGLVVRR